jgi:hypothetical protein
LIKRLKNTTQIIAFIGGISKKFFLNKINV